MHDTETSALAQAIFTWESGRHISLVLATKLMEEGYDLPSLENHYFNQ
jgi:hypothetical protein